jgi:hypothetical protein
MRIRQQRVLNLEKHINRVPDGAEYRIIHRIEPAKHNATLALTGFPTVAEAGSTILPKVVGPVTKFNAHGRRVPLRHLPKERRYIRTIEWTWEQWEGRYDRRPVTEERDIYRDCYPVKEIPPPAVEVTLVQFGETWIISSPKLRAGTDNESGLHVVNLFLELYGECEIVGDDLRSFDPPVVKQVNWRLLPPGRYPWEKVAEHLDRVLRVRDPRIRTVILHRHETIRSYGPDEVYVGEGGFDRYVAYVFASREIVVLECTELDNAIYVFGRQWTEFSKMSKAEILSGKHHLERIVHSKGWRLRFDRLMRNSLPRLAG